MLDLASFASIKQCAASLSAELDKIDVLIENAAVCCVPNTPTEHGLEPHLGVNHYGHFLLRQSLLPKLAASAPSRVVVIASSLHDRLFDLSPTELDLSETPSHLGWTTKPKLGMMQLWMAYARSKLANVMSAAGQAKELDASGIKIVSVHPGIDTTTDLFRAQRTGGFIMRWLPFNPIGVQSTWQSVQTALHCTLAEHSDLVPGAFYSQFYKGKYRDGETGGWPMAASPNPLASSPEACAELVKISHAVVSASGKEGESLDVASTPTTPASIMIAFGGKK